MHPTRVDFNLRNVLFNPDSQRRIIQLWIAAANTLSRPTRPYVCDLLYAANPSDRNEEYIPKKNKPYDQHLHMEVGVERDTPELKYQRIRAALLDVMSNGSENELCYAVIHLLYSTSGLKAMVVSNTEPMLGAVFFHMFTRYMPEMLSGAILSGDQGDDAGCKVYKACAVPSEYAPVFKTYYMQLVSCHRLC
jgi:hypothetical protein